MIQNSGVIETEKDKAKSRPFFFPKEHILITYFFPKIKTGCQCYEIGAKKL